MREKTQDKVPHLIFCVYALSQNYLISDMDFQESEFKSQI